MNQNDLETGDTLQFKTCGAVYRLTKVTPNEEKDFDRLHLEVLDIGNTFTAKFRKLHDVWVTDRLNLRSFFVDNDVSLL